MSRAGVAASIKSQAWLPLSLDSVILNGGLLLMYIPTIYKLVRPGDAGLWSTDEHAHGPLILLISLWLINKKWLENKSLDNHFSYPAPGHSWAWLFLIIGLFLYVSGAALGIIYFEVGSFIPMLMGVILLIGGWSFLNKLKFPVFFLIFMIPLPGFIVEPISHFIKLNVSAAVAFILTWANYPIGRTGVILSIGQYQLLVADACSGMRTLFMLEALGIFYLNVVQHTSWLRNIVLTVLIVPISFMANMIRVIFLVLLTYYFGDEVGQGFLHGFAGMVLFISALVLIISLDGILRVVTKRYSI